MGKITREEAIETLRKGLVYAGRTGDRLVLFCGNIAPDFTTVFSDKVNFPTEKIFNFAEWRKEENFKSILKEGEDHDLMGNKKCYYLNPNFDLVILQNEDDEEEKQELIAKIPHVESFDVINVS